MTGSTSYEAVMCYVTEDVRRAMEKVPLCRRSELTEVRLYSGRAAAFVYPSKVKFLTCSGELTSHCENPECVTTSAADLAKIVNALCRYSMHSCPNELREGYFVIEGGVRVGASGTTSEASGGIIRDFNALNFRISREVKGCAEEVFNRTSRGSIIICGGVNSGKTTFLRDLCRLCGRQIKTVLIDERSEIAALRSGTPTMDVGALTAVIAGMKRSSGITSAVRTLSPDMIFCDEISTQDDSAAILNAHGSGIRFAATIHAVNYSDLLARECARSLLAAEVFDYAVFLGGGHAVKEIRRLKE